MNVEKDFSYVESKIRKENDYFYESFDYHKYRMTNYTFLLVLESNEFTICASFLIRFAIRFKRAIKI